jgi:alpha-tubulin suppressor-like RCC1 family protein/archaellum component FlaG (FlaF/FlaG flagellin family)
MKSTQKSSVISLLILFFLISSLIFPINALADEATPPADVTATATEAPVTEVPITETPAATEAPATEVPATEIPATEAAATAVPAMDVLPTEPPAIPEPSEVTSLAEIVQDMATNDLTLVDETGVPVTLASNDAAERIATGDPYIDRGGIRYYFLTDCTGVSHCTTSANPIQAAINFALAGETIVVGPGIYNENLIINTANLTLMGDPGITTSPGAGPNAPVLDGTGLPGTFDANGDGVPDSIGITINAEGFSLIGFIIQNFDLAIYQPVISGSNTINILNNTIRDNHDGILVRKGTGSPGTIVQYNIFTGLGEDGFALSNNPDSNNEQFLDARYNYWGCASGPVVAYKIFRGNTWTGDWGYIDWATKTDYGSNNTQPNPDPACAVLYGHDPLYDFQIKTGDYSPYKIILDPVGIPLCEDPEANNYGEPGPCDYSTPPAVNLSKTVDVQTLPEPGGNFTFTLTIVNNSTEAVTINALTDTNSLPEACTGLIGTTLAASDGAAGGADETSCSYVVNHTEPGTYNNQAAVTVVNGAGAPASDTASQIVTVENLNPGVTLDKSATPASLPEPGGAFTFTLTITNTSIEPVTITDLSDDNALSPQCLALVNTSLAAGASTSCSYQVTHTETGSYLNTASVTVSDNENVTATATDSATVSVTNVGPTIGMTKTASPMHVPETGGNVTFTFVVTNNSVEAVTLTSLSDSVFGDLNGQGTCVTGGVIAAGGSYSCAITVFLSSDSLADHNNTATATATDNDGATDEASDSETVTFDNVAPAIRMTKTASPTSVPETGANVTFTFLVENIGQEDVTLTSLSDTVFGDLDGKGTCDVPQTILTGGSYSCTYTVFLASDSLTAHTNVVTATGNDDDGTPTSDDDTETVTFDNVEPAIRMTKTASPTHVPETGGNVTFTFLVENIGQEDITLTALNDTVFGSLDGKGTCDVPQTILISGSYSCTYTILLSSDSLTPHYNVVTATGIDDDQQTDTASDDATVSFDAVAPDISITKTANPTHVPETGGNVTFTFLVENTGVEDVTLTSLNDTIFGNLNGQGDCVTGVLIPVGGSYSCSVTRLLASDSLTAHYNVVTAIGTDDDQQTDTATDNETVTFDDVGPSITISKTANPTHVPETGGDVTFTFVVTNDGEEDVTLTSLTDNVFGDLNGKGDCTTGTLLPTGGVYSCSYTVFLASDSLTAHSNVVTATGTDDDGTSTTDTDNETVTFDNVAPAIRITKTANPTQLPESGGNVTFSFLVENIGQEDVTLTTLNDTVFGNLDGKGSCEVPQTILIGGSYSCAYTLFLSSNTLTAHYNVVTAGAVDDDGTQASDTDDERVSFDDQPPSVTLDKTASPLTLPEHSTGFTYTLTIHNTSVETVTITTLTDSSALSAECLALIGTSIPAGGTVTCHYTVLRPEPGTYGNVAAVTVADNENNSASDTDEATVTVTDALPSVKLTKDVDNNVRYMPGGWFTYTLTITNESVETVTITRLTDDNILSTQCLALTGQTLAPGESKSCQYRVKRTEEGKYPNRADVTVQDNEGNSASDTDTISVTVEGQTTEIIPVTGGETHAIAAGIAHTCAITAEGGVQCWGNNKYGQLGNGSNQGSNIPVDVLEVQGGTSIVAGGNHTCLLSSNDVWCWGQNAQGQVGDGTTTDRNVPVKILSGAADITAGLNYSCAVMLNGKVMCWGDNDQGQLADGSKRDHTKPTLAALITGVSNIDAGQTKSCGLTETGLLRCVSSPAAATAAGLVPVMGALSEPSLDVAVDRFGSVILAIDEQGMPIVFQGSRVTKIESIQDAIDVDSGFNHICALLNDGTVRCWGSNNFGQLGDNSGTNGQDPRQVVDLSSAWEIAVGKNHSCVLIESDVIGVNEIQCWGLNTDGQLGNGSNQNSPVPVFVVEP